MTKYEKVTLLNGTSCLLRVESESEAFLIGIEVDKYGDEVVPRAAFDAKGRRYTERRRLIAKDAIRYRRPMAMSLKYAELVPELVPAYFATPAEEPVCRNCGLVGSECDCQPSGVFE